MWKMRVPFAEGNLKGNISVLAWKRGRKKNRFDDTHLLRIKIGWNRGLWRELVQRDK